MARKYSVKRVVQRLLQRTAHLLDLTLAEYFGRGVDLYSLTSQQLAAINCFGHLTLHEFVSAAVFSRDNAEVCVAFDYLTSVNREPLNHLDALFIYYTAAKKLIELNMTS